MISRPINTQHFIALTIPLVSIGGAFVSLLGFGVGVVLTLTTGFPWIGGFGTLPGYEGAAPLSGMIFSALATLLLIRYWLKDQEQARVGAYVIYVVVWLVCLLLQNIALSNNFQVSIPYIVLPAVITGVLLVPLLLSLEQRE